MKTKNKIQKTVFGLIAIFLSSFLMCSTSSAFETKSKSETKVKNASSTGLPVKTKKSLTKTEQAEFLLNYETEQEKTLEIEYWMINEKNFEPIPAKVKKEPKEKQVAIAIENNSNFGRRLFIIFMEFVEVEPALEIEGWMVDQQKWIVK